MGTVYKEGKKKGRDRRKISDTKRKFDFPSNVKQIGGINRGIKIYIEDYAYNYIQKLGSKRKETAAFLIGYLTEETGEETLVIMGAAEPPFLAPAKDGQVFSEEDIYFGESAAENYFGGMQIVGWTRVQPGYGLYLSAADIGNHYLNFTDRHSVLLLCDSEERLDCFFAWNENQDDLDEVSGYFIFYDKNPGMNSFLTDAKKASERKDVIEAPETIPADDMEELKKARKDISAKHVEKTRRTADFGRQKKVVSMMTGISMLLLFACVILGVGLLQSGERIALIENQMTDLRNGYNNIASRLNDSSFPAFAAQELYVPQETDGISQMLTENNADDELTLDQALGIVPVTETHEGNETTESEPSYEDALTESAAESITEGVTEGITGWEEGTVTSEAETSINSPETAPSDLSGNGNAGAANDTSANETAAKPTPETTEYVVQRGDTLSQISQLFYGTPLKVNELMRANSITDPSRLRVGATLIIP